MDLATLLTSDLLQILGKNPFFYKITLCLGALVLTHLIVFFALLVGLISGVKSPYIYFKED